MAGAVPVPSRGTGLWAGVATVEDLAEVINRGLNPGARHVVPRSRPFPSWGQPDEPSPPNLTARRALPSNPTAG